MEVLIFRKEALPDPRVVEIAWCYDIDRWYCPRGTQTPSGLIRANKESRDVFLKTYVPCARQWVSKYDENFSEPSVDGYPINYIDVWNDTLYIGANYALSMQPRAEALVGLNKLLELSNLGLLRSLALLAPVGSSRIFSRWVRSFASGYAGGELRKLLEKFPRLTELIIMIEIRHETRSVERRSQRNRMPPPGEIGLVDAPVDEGRESCALSELRKVNLEALRKSEGPNTPLLIKRAIRHSTT
jgi:hypothetical protein